MVFADRGTGLMQEIFSGIRHSGVKLLIINSMKLTTLTPSQSQLLEAAACHPQRLLTDFPAKLKGGALIKVLTSLGTRA